MKKLIVTGCTLILSLVGAFGVNKNSTDLANQLNTNTTIDSNLAVEEQDSTEATENNKIVAEEASTKGNEKSKALENKVNIYTNTEKEEDKEVAKETATEAVATDKNVANDNKSEATVVGAAKKEEAKTEVAKKEEPKTEVAKTEVADQSKEIQEIKNNSLVTTIQDTNNQDNNKRNTNNQGVQQLAQKNEAKTSQNNIVNQLNSNNIMVKQNNGSYQNTCVIQGNQIIVYCDGSQSNNQVIQQIIDQCNQQGGSISNANLQDIIASLQGQSNASKAQDKQNTTTQNNNNQGTTKPNNNNQGTVNQNNNNQGTTNQTNNNQSTPSKNSTTQSNTSNQSSLSSYASEVLRLVNAERAKEGLAALTTNSTITSAANKRAAETKTSFSHTRPNGTSFSTVLGEYGISYRTSGENIAYGQRTPQEVVTGWMNSEGHRRNIMNSSFGTIGIGVYQDANGTIYWSQLFTN